SSGYGNIADGEYLNFNKNSDNYAYVKDGYLVDETTEGAIKVATRSEYDFEDGTKTYAYLAAENIGADIGVFSKSGLGITVYGGKAEEDTETMSKWYPNLPVNNDADYVIINHITNDIAHYSTAAGLTLEGLADAYAEFITTVRKDHINAKIIVAYGMMSIPTTAADSEKVILDAVAKVKASDDAVYAIKLPTGLDGGGAHPTEEQHLKASELLTEFINGLDVIKTENCAGIRAKSDNLKQGIRVKNAISIAEIENKNIVTYGAVAIKKSNLKIDEALTLSSEKGVVGIAYNTNEDNGYKVVSEPILREYTDTENIYSAVLINIKNRYFADSYLVRSFAIDANGSVYYGEVTEVSVFAVVYSILEGENAEDISTANSIVDEIITADATDTAGVITTYAEWCAVNGVVDNSASANK
ncbi:MAG: hypothetical protein J6D52_09505, partial [Clostridia bacterium]|nr:hypothetical protein [Clostridia bacterium]